MNIKKWWEVFSGNEENNFFVALARNPNFTWRTIDKLAKNAGLSIARAEEIAEKYVLAGQVVQSQKDPTKFAYFENISKKAPKDSISSENKKKRVVAVTGKAP